MSDISDILDNLREGFLYDLPVRINSIEEEVIASEENDSYDELFRMVHSLKGSAGSYNFHAITRISHSMEDIMLTLMQKKQFGTASTIDILLKYIDLFRVTTEALNDTKSAPHDIDERLESLRSEVIKDNLKVLVVEPSKLYASMIEHSLADLAVNFTFMEDGFQGLENLLHNKYDLLITSLECPSLNGDALVAALRLVHNFNKDIKVILITSRKQEKITNINDFDSIYDRKAVKDGGLNHFVKDLVDLKE